AREYGIPAVMGTGVATERIKSGMMLAVDGDAGTVTLLDDVQSLAEESAYAQNLAEEQAADKKQPKTSLALIAGMLIALIWWWKKRE
ncbi:MAG: PEP-utilizing enzyme, partial [Ardenticatenaceae bacterium]